MSAPSPEAFYTEQLPSQWNQGLAEQARAAEGDEDARRVLGGMRAVDATIEVRVDGDAYFLNIAAGEMAAGAAAAQEPFLILVQDQAGFERLVAEAGDSAMGFLGGLSGLAGDMKLTRGRLALLADVSGSLHFEVGGDDGFALRTHFGAGPVPDEPTTRLTVAPEAYAALRAGELQAQDAFMGGQIQVEGDMQLAMQVALAALSPD